MALDPHSVYNCFFLEGLSANFVMRFYVLQYDDSC